MALEEALGEVLEELAGIAVGAYQPAINRIAALAGLALPYRL